MINFRMELYTPYIFIFYLISRNFYLIGRGYYFKI